MLPSEYEKILSALPSAAHVLTANQGELNPADIRIRCLVNIATKESKRAMLESTRWRTEAATLQPAASVPSDRPSY